MDRPAAEAAAIRFADECGIVLVLKGHRTLVTDGDRTTYNTTGNGNIYLAHPGVGTENNTTRIGSSQTAAFIAGVYGATVSAGSPVYVDSTGHLGTGGGTLPSAELSGTYTQQLTLNNTTNVYGGSSVSVSGAVTGGQINSIGGYQINGTTIPKGSPIVFMYGAANRDPRKFRNPNKFDLEREEKESLGWGAGIHVCFGGQLARLEVNTAVEAFLRRVENPRLVVDPPPYRRNALFRGPLHVLIDIDRIRD